MTIGFEADYIRLHLHLHLQVRGAAGRRDGHGGLSAALGDREDLADPWHGGDRRKRRGAPGSGRDGRVMVATIRGERERLAFGQCSCRWRGRLL